MCVVLSGGKRQCWRDPWVVGQHVTAEVAKAQLLHSKGCALSKNTIRVSWDIKFCSQKKLWIQPILTRHVFNCFFCPPLEFWYVLCIKFLLLSIQSDFTILRFKPRVWQLLEVFQPENLFPIACLSCNSADFLPCKVFKNCFCRLGVVNLLSNVSPRFFLRKGHHH